MFDSAIICRAIRERKRLEFSYANKHRVVEPYLHGHTTTGAEALRAVQVGGDGTGFGFGKLWLLDKMSGLRITAKKFDANDPNYNPADSAMTKVHCRV